MLYYNNCGSITSFENDEVGKAEMVRQGKNFLDKIGIAITSLCAVHCILLPALLPILPLIGVNFLATHEFEHSILLITIVLGSIALFSGFHRYHRKLYPFYAFTIGIFIYWNKDALGETYEPFVLIFGAIFIVLSHILNIRLCNACRGCDTQEKHEGS